MKKLQTKSDFHEDLTKSSTHTHTQLAHLQLVRRDFFTTFKTGFFRTIFTITFVFTIMTGWSQENDPCDCTTFTTIGVPGESRNISAVGPIPDCAFIRGQLVIDDPTTWDNLSIRMATGSEILVIDSLAIVNGTFISTCDSMWIGITTDNTDTVPNLHVLDSYIKGAEIAMRLDGHTTFECSNNLFIDNFIGIATGSPFENDEIEVLINQVGFLTGCWFYTADGLPDPYPGQFYSPAWPTSPSQIPFDVGFAAMYLTGTSGLNFGNPNASGADRNRVFNMRNGIIARYSYVDIHESTFRNFQGSIVNTLQVTPINQILFINQTGIDLLETVAVIENNLFSNLLQGIISENSDQTIQFDTFDIATSPALTTSRAIEARTPSGFIAVGNRIKHGFIGISIQGTNEPFLIKQNHLIRNIAFRRNIGIHLANVRLPFINGGDVLDNFITTEIGHVGSIGIAVTDCHTVRVRNNEINFPISLNAGINNAGISGMGVTNSIISYNDITGASAYETETGNSGIVMTNSFFNYIFCNQMDEMYRGMWLVGPHDRTDVVANTFLDANIAFELWGPVALGDQRHNGNEWYGNYFGGYGAYIEGPNPLLTAAASTFYIDTLDEAPCILKPCPLGPFDVSDNEWFVHDTGVAKSCIAIIDPDIPIADTIVKLIRSELDFSDYNDEMTWIRKADVFDILLTFPTLLSNTVLDSFFDAEVNRPLGKLVWAHHQMTKRHGSVLSLKEAAIEGIMDFGGQIYILDSLIDLDPVNKATLLALRVLKLDTLQTYLTDWLGQQEDERLATLAMIEDAVDTAQLVTTTNDLESNLKDIIILSEPAFRGDTLDAMAASGVEFFATQCPWLGGRSLVMGQILFHMITDSTLSNTPYDCMEMNNAGGGEEYARKEQKNVQSRTVVYPNPAADIVHIDMPSGIAEVHIYDAQGILKISHASPGKQIIMDIQTLPSGIYIISILQHNKVSSHKLNILR